jgi:hypothetical protein
MPCRTSSSRQKLEILLANPFLLRMAGFQALIGGWFSAPADRKNKLGHITECAIEETQCRSVG